MRRATRAAACLAVASFTGIALAGPHEPTAGEVALARRLFVEARAAEQAHEWAKAIAKLREALVVKETAGLRFHLAFCEEQSGALVDALGDYDRATDALASAPDAELAPRLRARRDELRARVPTLTVRLAPPGAIATVFVDGNAVRADAIGAPIPLDPGAHHVAASTAGTQPVARELVLAEGERREIELVVASAPPLAAEPAPRAPAAATPAHAPAAPIAANPTGSARPWVLAGEATLAVAGLALGASVWLGSRSADDRADVARASLPTASACADGGARAGVTGTCADLQSAVDASSRDRTLAVIGLGGGAVAAVALAATWSLWRDGRRATVAVVPAPGGAEARASVAF